MNPCSSAGRPARIAWIAALIWTSLLLSTQAVRPLAAAGPAVAVEVVRDHRGIPHVRSSTDAGAFYGLGWASARDRLLQMNLNVWAVQGRMAEAAGGAWVEQDRHFRIVGMWRHAVSVAGSLDSEHRELLQAFSDGVNRWVADHPELVNPLFSELGVSPEAWTPAHCIAAWWRVANLFISDPFKKASAYYEFMDLVDQVGLEQAIEDTLAGRHPGDPAAGVVQVDDVPEDVRLAIEDYADSVGYGDEGKGYAASHPASYDHLSPSFSHAWVIGGGRTTTGAAVLISDPQTTVTWPNLFFEWHAAGATFNARGIGVPGCAGLLIGFNEHVAWGLTAAGADQRDLMRLDMVDRTTYLVDGAEHRLEQEVETILVKNGHNESVTWRRSLWGPVVTPLVNQVRPGDEFALKGIPYCEPDRETFQAMLAMLRAQDMDAFRAALDHWRFPSANVVAGDRQGSIFFTILGALPVRSVESPLAGLIAQEGDSLAFEWQDTVPGIYKPWVLDPADGFLLSANHRAAGDWYPIKLGMGFMGTGDTTRSRRLRELLLALPPRATPPEILELTQYDCVNSSLRDMVAVLRHARDRGAQVTADASSALDHLAPWSTAGGSNLTDDPGVFLASKIPTNFRVLQTGETMHALYGGGQGGLNLFLKTMVAEIAADPSFVPSTDAVTYLEDALSTAWQQAMAASSNPDDWDQLHAEGWSVNPRLEWFANPNALGADFASGYAYTPPPLQCTDGGTIWSQRGESSTQFVDLAAVDHSLSLTPPGATEGPGDGWWTALGDDWASGTLGPAPLSQPAVGALAVEKTVLVYVPGAGEPPPAPRHARGRVHP